MRVTDRDVISDRDDHVDDFYVLINIKPGESIGPITTVGEHNNGRITLSFQLICQPGFYDRDCATYCVPADDDVNGHFTCGPNGKKICRNGWQDPGNHCLTCKLYVFVIMTFFSIHN